MQSIICSNSRYVLREMISRGLNATQAAAEANLRLDLFGKIIRQDKPISYKTAGRLTATFGADAVKFSDSEEEKK